MGGDCRDAGNSGRCLLMCLLSSSDTLPAAFFINTAVSGVHHSDTTPTPGGKGKTAVLETFVSCSRTLERWQDEATAKASAARPHLPPMRAVEECRPMGKATTLQNGRRN